MKIGFANGCFDCVPLHAGHINFLRECRKHCEVLFVGMNSDESVRRLKGEGRPIHTADRRAQALLQFADGVNSFDTEMELAEIIKAIKPDVIFKGEEYRSKTVTGAHLAPTHWIPRTPGVSSTQMVKP